MSGFLHFATSSWVLYPTVALAGLLAGSWIDGVLARRERRPLEEQALQHHISRLELANRADEIARKIGELAGEAAGRSTLAWSNDTGSHAEWMASSPENRGRTFSTRNSAQERALAITKYGPLDVEARSILDMAARVMPLDQADLFKVKHMLSSGQDFGDMAAYLTHIGNSLRYPNEPLIPFSDRRRDEITVASQGNR